MTRPGRPGTTAAVLFGGAAAFVVAEQLVQAIRPALLLDPDPTWTVVRYLLWIFLICATSAAGTLAAALFYLWSRSRLATGLAPLPLSRRAVIVLCAAALLAGMFLRFVWIDTLPIPFFEDEINLIGPSLGLSGHWRDFANSIRPMPYGVSNPHEMIGVLYLRLFRQSLDLFGTTILGVRFLSFAGGVLSLLTGTLLGRALLPSGGAALTALILAGLRWHLILSRFGWHSIVVVPLADLATLLLVVSARRRQRAGAAALAGAVLGIGAHFYLAAWMAFAGLLAFCLWPGDPRDTARSRIVRFGLCAAGFLVVAAPLFLLREGRTHGYFGRASRHSVLTEIRYTRSILPPFSVAADALVAPWLLPDPEAWNDLPGRSRLGWILGIPVAVAFARALLRPREELSGLLLANAGAAVAAAVAAGHAGHPSGFRFGYLTTLTAVAAAAGCLQLLRLAPIAGRRAAAVAAIGLLAANGAAGARDALLRWPESRSTFDAFHGEDTMVGRAAARWERYGIVRVAPGLGRSDLTIDTVRRYRLDPDRDRFGGGLPELVSTTRMTRLFRIATPRALPEKRERIVERIRDGWGRDWAVVIGGLRPPA